jgi:hypothetical protein
MAEAHSAQWPHQNSSSLPVAAPTPRRPSLSISQSISQLSLATTRKPSANVQVASHSHSSSNASGGTSGSSSLRTLRNLLPFGPAKQHQPPSNIPSSRSPFGGFGSARKSMNGERRISESSPLSQDAEPDAPTVTIQASLELFNANGVSDKKDPTANGRTKPSEPSRLPSSGHDRDSE